jgi:hypothetical protein
VKHDDTLVAERKPKHLDAGGTPTPANQVGWILGDADLHDFYSSLLKQAAKLSTELGDRLEAVVKSGEPLQNPDDILSKL